MSKQLTFCHPNEYARAYAHGEVVAIGGVPFDKDGRMFVVNDGLPIEGQFEAPTADVAIRFYVNTMRKLRLEVISKDD